MRAALRARARQYQARELLSRAGGGRPRARSIPGDAGHELRNPLGAIRNAAQLLERAQPPRSTPSGRWPSIDRQVRHLTRLVDDLLDVSRVTTGKIALQRARVDLRDVLRAAPFDSCEPALETQRLRSLVAGRGARCVVDGDPVRLEQIVHNLLTNASSTRPRAGAST